MELIQTGQEPLQQSPQPQEVIRQMQQANDKLLLKVASQAEIIRSYQRAEVGQLQQEVERLKVQYKATADERDHYSERVNQNQRAIDLANEDLMHERKIHSASISILAAHRNYAIYAAILFFFLSLGLFFGGSKCLSTTSSVTSAASYSPRR